MEDVNQILIWETNRKAKQWWNSLSEEERIRAFHKANIPYKFIPHDFEIVEMYNQR